MKKVHIPGSVIVGIIIVAVCIFGLVSSMSEGFDLRMILVLIIPVAYIVLFCRKNVQTIEEKPLQEGRKPAKSKYVASKEKDDAHQRKLLDLYMFQKEEYRKNARNGIVFGIVGIIVLFLMWGFGKIALPVFIILMIFCVYYAGKCIWQWFINSDKPKARELAAKFNYTTLQDQIEYTENVLFQNEEKRRAGGVSDDTIVFIDKKEYLESKEYQE